MKPGILFFLACIFALLSCQSPEQPSANELPSAKHSRRDPKVFSDTLKPFAREKCEWIYIRIHASELTKVQGPDSSNVMLEYTDLFHCLGYSDDNTWKAMRISIPDASKIKTDSVYAVPNASMKVDLTYGGAWVGSKEYFNPKGLICFYSLSYDSADVAVYLDGTTEFGPKNKPARQTIFSRKIHFIAQGNPEWELTEKREKEFREKMSFRK